MILRKETSSSFVFHLRISFDLLQNFLKKLFEWKVFRRYVPVDKLGTVVVLDLIKETRLLLKLFFALVITYVLTNYFPFHYKRSL